MSFVHNWIVTGLHAGGRSVGDASQRPAATDQTRLQDTVGAVECVARVLLDPPGAQLRRLQQCLAA